MVRVARPNLAQNATLLRVTWEAPATCNAAPPCAYCNTRKACAGRAALSAPAETWRRALLRLAERRGPLWLATALGDATADPDTMLILAELAYDNRVDVCTNLTAELAALRCLPRNGNVGLVTSFHPHLWGSLGEFLAKREAVMASGLLCGLVMIVAYPDHLERLQGWSEEIAAVGTQAVLLPFRGTYEGKQYPNSYSRDELRALYPSLELYGNGEAKLYEVSPRGRLCETGWQYVLVGWDGRVSRCWSEGGQDYGNLLLGDVDLPGEASACTSDYCHCPDLWRFVKQT